MMPPEDRRGAAPGHGGTGDPPPRLRPGDPVHPFVPGPGLAAHLGDRKCGHIAAYPRGHDQIRLVKQLR